MSTVNVAVHGGRIHRSQPHSHARLAERQRPVMRVVTFAALALYGVLRWSTLESPAPSARLFGLLALAVTVVAVAPRLDRVRRPLAIAGPALASIAMLAISGVPLAWLTHVRVAAIADGIGQGLSALPAVLVPYLGIDPWVKLVLALGAGVLLLAAAIMLAFAPAKLGDLRRASAALPLMALAIVPSLAVHPQLPYVQGFILFGLLAAFMWGERIASDRVPGAFGAAFAVGVGAMVIGPAIHPHRAWLNYQKLVNSAAVAHVETFDWTQRYGPFDWPRDGRNVFDVRAARPDYWKAEGLDVFNGVAWSLASDMTGSQVPGPTAAQRRRFTQAIQVTIRGMSETEVIAGGFASRPEHLAEDVVQGISPGTWLAGTPLRPGDSYTVKTYSPAPTAAELTADSGAYPVEDLAAELTVQLPPNRLQAAVPYEVQFPAFHARAPVKNVIGPPGVSGTSLVEGSPYAEAYALARRLAHKAREPYAFVLAVERYLSPSNGFVYDEHPPASRYPLEGFLFSTRRGYCQQFAGAMALLLRMGGVPARVATGFATGNYDGSLHEYIVSDLDAHAWVEAWFPAYGWVRFDPTPAAAPALGAAASLPSGIGGSQANGSVAQLGRRALTGATPAAAHARRHPGASGLPLAALVVLIAVVLVLAVLLAWALLIPPASIPQLVAELERALARAGRPIAGGTTLAALEHRFRASVQAQGYVRALRLARFADGVEVPGGAGRRALRTQLAAGLGLAGKVRAWWALPPRRCLRRALH